jgi:hypothetical protein
MTPETVVFLAGHPHNVKRMLGDKSWEGQSRRTGADWLIYCSSKRATAAWPMPEGIKKGRACVVTRILGIQKPGREHRPMCLGGGLWPYDWILGPRHSVAVQLPAGVGQGPRHPTANNPHLVIPFAQIKRAMYMSGIRYE